MLSIQEYAQRAGITPRAVRFRIDDGSLLAHKVAGRWVIPEPQEAPRALRPGRKIRARSFDLLAAYLEGDDARMSADDRRRAAERMQRIKKLGVEQVGEYAQRPDIPVSRYLASPRDLAELRTDPRLRLTGISHRDAEVYGPVVDAYVSRADHDDIELFHMLEPAPHGRANVTLRIQDPPPTVRHLHVIADLLDDQDPRSLTEARRLLAALVGSDG